MSDIATSVATVATRMDSRIAVHSPGVRSIMPFRMSGGSGS